MKNPWIIVLFAAAALVGLAWLMGLAGCAATDQRQPTQQQQSHKQEQEDQQWSDARINAQIIIAPGTCGAGISAGSANEAGARGSALPAAPGTSGAGAGAGAGTSAGGAGPGRIGDINLTIEIGTHGTRQADAATSAGPANSNTSSSAAPTNSPTTDAALSLPLTP